MSVYLQIGDGEGISLATNVGWGDICRAVEASKADLPILKKLVDQGFVDQCDGVDQEMKTLLASDVKPTVKTTLESMQETLDGVTGMIGIV